VSAGTAAPEVPEPRQLLRQLQGAVRAGRSADLVPLLRTLVDATDDLGVWSGAARALRGADAGAWSRRSLRLAVVGTSTTTHLTQLLPLVLARHGLACEVHETPYGQHVQEVLDPGSALHAFAPDVVLVVVDEHASGLPDVSEDPAAAVEQEVARWTGLWGPLLARGALVVQTTFAPEPDGVFGDLALRVPGSRRRLLRQVNLALGDAAPEGVLLVDAESAAASVGARAWHDDRYWHLSKNGVGLGALPHLARRTGAVVAAGLGLTRKCVVVDLDGTLWGGVVGEDGVEGLAIGDGPDGEAHVALQEHLLALRRRGVLLAVVTKNNEADARAPFERHSGMRLRLEHFSAFVASWDDKPGGLRRVAQELSLGTDSLVFVDDNPVEREAVRQALPEVEVVLLPPEASGYAAAVASHPSLEPGAWTAEDAVRADRYAARAAAVEASASAGSREEFLQSLDMEVVAEPVDESNLRRVVQLLGKTNQFNTTTRRHGAAEVDAMLAVPGEVCLALRVSDRFADHGLVAVVLGVPEEEPVAAGAERSDGGPGGTLRIDSWLMSCRVLGRGLETAAMRLVADAAVRRGHRRLLGELVPTDRNAPAQDAYAAAGFRRLESDEAHQLWELDLTTDDLPSPGPVRLTTRGAT